MFEQLDSEFNLTFGSVVEGQEMVGMNEIGKAVYCLVVLV